MLQQLIIQLGAPNHSDGSLSAIALGRCQTTAKLSQQYPDAAILCTGGFGEHFNQTVMPHWHWVHLELKRQGIAAYRLPAGIDSRFTFEDASLTLTWLLQQQSVQADNTELIIVTSDFHMPRAELIFNALLPNWQKHYLSAPTPLPEAEQQRLRQHELNVMDRERDNIARFKSAAPGHQ
ncbi:YdcF family protein [Shewanella sp. GXUN23E]|uniref:YdcF family protein n=1 Tax=Shewanella sp. GXUN23E TaxID=3422498 RepID=UPI003D7DC2FE